MKPTRFFFFMVALVALAVRLPAQAIQNIIITRTHAVTQTDASTIVDASATPFSFQAATEGDGSATDFSPITAAKVTLPNATAFSLNPPSVTGNGKWRYNSPGYANADALAGAGYDDGTYTMDLTGLGSANITLGSIASSNLLAPVLTLASAGGAWSGGNFTFVLGQDIHLSFGNISVGGGGDLGQYHYDLSVNGANTIHDNEHEPSDFVNAGEAPDPSGVGDFVISTATFLAGEHYTIEVGYGDIQSYNPDAFGDSSGYIGAGLYEIRSTITLTAIPEPSTYAAILGVVALAGVMIRRRRLQAV